MLTIGTIYRMPSPQQKDKAVVDGLSNFYYESNTPNVGFAFQKGIHNVQIISAPSGENRCPLIIISSTPRKAGSEDTPWHDRYDPDHGYVKYYGDNKDLTRRPEDAPGNKLLLDLLKYYESDDENDRLKNAVPVIFFEKCSYDGRPKGNAIFHGFGVLESAELVTQYDSKHNYFANYLFNFCIFSLAGDNEQFDWRWIADRCKEYKSKRKMIQEKLIKFATRVPVFMYLTDYREYSLQDVITQLEPELFKKVTGLDVKDFELLVSLNVFNEALMNDAVYKFKRYEDASLIYTGIDRHTGENVGLYSTVISREDYDAMAGQLATSMQADAPRDDDLPERPVFTNISNYMDDDDEEDDRPAARMVAEPKATYGSKRTPIAQPSRPASGSTYRPAYVPPTPSSSAPAKKPKIKVDLSKVHAGTIVRHKGYGLGQVKGIDGAIIVVTFDGIDKKFQFPGGFENGFLFLTEDE